MKQFLVLLLVFIGISCHSAIAQNYIREDSLLTDIARDFLKNSVLMENRARPIDSNDLEYLALMTVLLGGGSFDKGSLHIHSDGLLRKIGENIGGEREAQVQDEILKKYLDRLKIENVDDLLKLMKQTSWNKDKPINAPEPPPKKTGSL